MSPTSTRATKAGSTAPAGNGAEDMGTAEAIKAASAALAAAAEVLAASAEAQASVPKATRKPRAASNTVEPTAHRSSVSSTEQVVAAAVVKAPTADASEQAVTSPAVRSAPHPTDGEDEALTVEDFIAKHLGEENQKSDPTGDLSSLGQYLRQYSTYVAMFVGAGLISGSIVHFPLAPGRYLTIGICGATLFAFASVAAELRKGPATPAGIVKVIVVALLLSLGIGMTSGGIQHFTDFPDRAAKLVPGGIALSMVAFMVRDGYRLASDKLLWLVAGAVSFLIALAIGLAVVAGNIAPSEGHSHAPAEATDATETTATDDHAAAEAGSTATGDHAETDTSAHGH